MIALHRILFPDAAIQRSVDGHPHTVMLDRCCYEALAAILLGTSTPPHQPAQILFLMTGLSWAEHAQDAGIVLPGSLTRAASPCPEPESRQRAGRRPSRLPPCMNL